VVYNLVFSTAAPEFQVLSADGTPPPASLDTSVNGIMLDLKIAKAAPASPAAAPSVPAEGQTEAQKVYQEFLDATAVIKTDPRWDGFLSIYRVGKKTDAQRYEAYTSLPAQNYLDLDDYMQYVVCVTFIDLCDSYTSVSRDSYFRSEKDFMQRACFVHLKGLQNLPFDTTVQQEAYKKIMLWQYNYIQANGEPYCFETGGVLPKEVADPSTVVIPGEAADPAVTEEDKEQIEEIKRELEKEIPQDTSVLGMVKKSLPSIIILIVIAAAVLGFFLWKRKKNIDTKSDVK
jgi:hypothetical protein